MTLEELRNALADTNSISDKIWDSFLCALEDGSVCASEMSTEGEWRAVAWVKSAILSGFKAGGMKPFPWPRCVNPRPEFGDRNGMLSGDGEFYDRPSFPPRMFAAENSVRMVPGGSSVRRGAYVAPGVVIMPPSYINVGAWVGPGTMVDSHALVGSCARIGRNVHLSAGAQIGGVLEPAQARPVIIEDNVFVGGLCGIFEGVVVRSNAVLSAGVILTGSTKIYDLVNGIELQGEVPESAVVVPGSRPAHGAYASEMGISLQAPCIVKYRDAKTEAAVALEKALRA
jgi:2,3,4,5-tetrahydropyridine-2-carboxylate N-succinyltransferase